ncbi:MAG: VOC family protein [Balneolaceae bacterium]|nr:VOC family protein [Balneolaceae bacterium]
MQFSQIKETCLYVQDLDKTEAFYKNKLQLDVIGKEEGRHVFFRVGSSVLLCFIADATKKEDVLPAHYGQGSLHIAFEVPKEQYKEIKAADSSKGY